MTLVIELNCDELDVSALPSLCSSPRCLNSRLERSDLCQICVEKAKCKANPPAVSNVYLYAIAPAKGLIKIGYTQNVLKRFAALQSASPVRLKILGYAPGGRDLEKATHRYLRDYRMHGEWFRASPPVLEIVNLLARGDAEAIKKLVRRSLTLK